MSGAGIWWQDYGGGAAWPAAITVPARNEAARIVACLDAARLALDGRGGIVVMVNGSTDATRDIVCSWFRRAGTPGIVLDEVAPPAGSGVGRSRRLAIEAAAAVLRPDGCVLTTDADSCVAPDWLDANLDELARADLIAGTILPDPTEAVLQPEIIGQRGAPEGEYVALTMAARRALDPVEHDPWPAHMQPGGASLAFRLALYRDVGGMPDLTTGEDRAFAARAEARDWRLRHSPLARVWTSCRLDGRTPGGMSGALRERISGADPLVDESLEPPAATLLRARLKGELRKRYAGRPGFGAAWADLEAAHPELVRRRMRLSELERHLPALRRALARLLPRGRPATALAGEGC